MSFLADSYLRQAVAATEWDWNFTPLAAPADIDPVGHLKHDGWWMLQATRLPVVAHGFWGYQVPVFEPDWERWWYDVCLRKRWQRPPWLLAHGVAL